MSEYNISELADNEMRQFAMYTIENRAIPNLIDGLKPSQRFYLYSSIINTPKKFKKVSAVGGIVSDYGYNHGEGSILATGQLMAAEWSNNICLVEGEGSFGTRQVQAAGAPRYVFTRLHENFSKYIKDVDLAPEHDDPEHLPPAFYVPVIPFVLINGARGIATGFATHILPRSPESITEACREYVKTGNITNKPKIQFPQFTGTVEYNEETGQYISRGTFEKEGKTKLVITEIPYSFDREGYVNVLNKLEESGEISSYEDKCSDTFKFEVTLKKGNSSNWDDQTIIRKFKLEKPYTENLNVVDEDGHLRQYDNEIDIIKDFCEYRLNNVLKHRIEANLKNAQDENEKLLTKIAFIGWFMQNEYSFKNKNRKTIVEEISNHIGKSKESVDAYVMPMNFYSLTQEEVEKLLKKQSEVEKVIEYWMKTTPKKQFLEDLKNV